MTDLERAAKALQTSQWDNGITDEAIIRTVLGALLDPTSEVLEAGMKQHAWWDDENDPLRKKLVENQVRATYRAMINKILGDA